MTEDLKVTLDISFQVKSGRILIRHNPRGRKIGSGKKKGEIMAQVGSEEATEVRIYSAVILGSLMVVALLGVVICEVVRRKHLRSRGLGLNLFDRNELLCRVYNEARSKSNERSRDVKDLHFVMTRGRRCNEVRLSIGEQEVEKDGEQEKELKLGRSEDHGARVNRTRGNEELHVGIDTWWAVDDGG